LLIVQQLTMSCLVGASLQKLMDSGNWALLPSSEIIMQYASTLEQIGKFTLIADRSKFPDLEASPIIFPPEILISYV
jgi:hypothetical protein